MSWPTVRAAQVLSSRLFFVRRRRTASAAAIVRYSPHVLKSPAARARAPLTRQSGLSLSRQIYELLRHRILSGEFPLVRDPSEHELCRELAVSRDCSRSPSRTGPRGFACEGARQGAFVAPTLRGDCRPSSTQAFWRISKSGSSNLRLRRRIESRQATPDIAAAWADEARKSCGCGAFVNRTRTILVHSELPADRDRPTDSPEGTLLSAIVEDPQTQLGSRSCARKKR